MKVLLVGNDEFIIENIAQRFLLEDDKVIVLSSKDINLTQSILKKITHYNFEISSEICQNIFNVHIPDLVIYLDNVQKNCKYDIAIGEVNDHVDSFLNIYRISSYFNVKKFVYLSTIDLYDINIEFPDEDSKVLTGNLWESAHQLCEQHMLNVGNFETMNSLIVRSSAIFGPSQKKENSEISLYIDELLYGEKQEELKKITHSHFGRDYIYIEDFAEGVYQCASSDERGILNLASGKKYSIPEIFKLIDTLHENINADSITLDYELSCDVAKVANRVDFITNTDIFSGIYGVIVYENEKDSQNEKGSLFSRFLKFFKKKKSTSEERSPWLILLTYIETILLFGVVAYFVMVKDITLLFGYIDIRILYILIIGVIHGLKHSAIATALCITLLLYDYIIKGYSALLLIYDGNFMSAIFIFLLSGMILGYHSDRNKLQIQEFSKTEKKLKEQLFHLKQMYYDSLKVKESLQGQIYNSENSFGRVFGMISQLDSLDFNKLKGEIIRVTVDIMGNNSIALYMLGRNKNFLRLLAKSPNLTMLDKSVAVSESPEFSTIIKTKELFVNREIGSDTSMVMASPVLYNDEVIAVIVMYDADVNNLTLSYQNLFNITMKLVNQSIVRAYKYQQAQEDEWYIAGTNVLKHEYMLDKIIQSIDMQKRGVSNFVLVKIIQNGNEDLINIVPGMIREFDFVGYYKEEILVLLNNTTLNEFTNFVQKRFMKSGIETKVLKVV